MTQLVIGMGEVGRALVEVLDCAGRDVEDNGERGSVLHIAYPWSDQFVAHTERYAEEYQAELVVVHSTVPVGTCDLHGWVHSPVRGRHPHLTESLKTFPKVFGARHAEKSLRAAILWPYEAVCVPDARTSEAGKLWELAQFGLQVRVCQAIHDWCDAEGLDGELVYRLFATQYNEGYQAMGEPRFVRPILDYMPGPIGGHCVAAAMDLLDHPIAEEVKHGYPDM